MHRHDRIAYRALLANRDFLGVSAVMNIAVAVEGEEELGGFRGFHIAACRPLMKLPLFRYCSGCRKGHTITEET